MSSRFHNKFHRHNHHTRNNGDSRYPDAGYDPIASETSPFQGDFFLDGSLSASNQIIGTYNFGTPIAQISAVATTGEFIRVNVRVGNTNEPRYIRLWDYTGT